MTPLLRNTPSNRKKIFGKFFIIVYYCKMKYSETSKMILDANNIGPEREKEFIKELRLALRLDHEIPATEVRKLNDNKVIEKWYEINSLPENRIGGS
jgi:hypothetical protein